VLTRHSGLIRMQSWRKGFTTRHWVAAHHKTAFVGVGDWIEMTGSGAQADIVLPDLTTILMRKAAELQILKLGGDEHEFRLQAGISYDITLRETPTRISLPGGIAVRGKLADLLVLFQRPFERIRVRHARGMPLQVSRDGRIVRTLDPGESVDLDVDLGEPKPTGAPQDISKPFVFTALGRRVEIPPGVLYKLEGRKLSFRRDSIHGTQFGVIRIGDEVIVVGPGTTLEADL
jgi:hypothetical protein